MMRPFLVTNRPPAAAPARAEDAAEPATGHELPSLGDADRLKDVYATGLGRRDPQYDGCPLPTAVRR